MKRKTFLRGIALWVLSSAILLTFSAFSFAETDVTSKIQLNPSSLLYGRRTGTNYFDVSLTNISREALQTPIKVVIDSISVPGVTVANAEGSTTGGKPYFSYSSASGVFLPDQTTSKKRWVFSNPNRVRFDYSVKVLAELLNTPPVANAGPDQTSFITQTVQLDGSKSSDVDGNTLNFTWSFVSRPSGSTATLSDPSAVKPTFTVDVSGTYVAQLIVNDGLVNSAPDTVTISTGNTAPVANAGPDQSVNVVGQVVQLNGSASSDVDGNPLTFAWSFVSRPSGSSATLSNTTIVNPTFTVDKFGDYVVQLIVNDGFVNSSPDTVTISTLNSKPVANAGPDQTIHAGKEVFLDGSASSDVDGNPLTYAWSFTGVPSGSAAVLLGRNTVNPSFESDKVGDYVVQLIVNDGIVNSNPDSVTISTTNSKPVAEAGSPQSVTAESTVQLDGSGSSDADGDVLDYFWAFTVIPDGSTAVLSDEDIVNPTFVADRAGTYVAQLIVNDGFVGSNPDTASITAISKTVTVPNVVNLTQAAAESAIIAVKLAVGTITQANSATVPAGNVVSQNPAAGTSVAEGTSVSLVISSGPAMVSVPNVVGTTQAVAQSTITAASLLVGTITQANSTSVPIGSVISQNPAAGTSVAERTPVNLVISSGPVKVNVPNIVGLTQSEAQSAITGAKLILGTVITATSTTVLAGRVISQSPAADTSVSEGSPVNFVVSLGPLTVTVPNVIGLAKAAAQSAIETAGLTVGTVTSDYHDTIPSGSVISQNPSAGGSVPQGSAVALTISLGPAENLPPDPVTVAPPIDPTVATTIATATEFLYTGSNPIQTGVAPGTIDSKRVAVVRGIVLDRNNNPLSGVVVSILNHPEFGQTLSRADGMFDLAVNGGGYLTLNYQKTGYLSAQRQVDVPWQDYAWLPDVVLTQLDSRVTLVDLASIAPIQVARGSVMTDSDGTRQGTLLIPQGTTAQLVMPDGSTQPITSLKVRASEYTVGPNGPNAMPGELPPTSGYTYAVELTADEAIAAGAAEVRFSQPLYYYVEDFIGFPVGGAVPTGYYDRQKGQWIASENGRVVKILGISGELANLDTDGNGAADDATTLAALGISDAERRTLASLYSAGQALWRVPITHFTPWDCNWPYGAPDDAVTPPAKEPKTFGEQLEDFTIECRSIVECQNQVLLERVALTGTPFTLSYSSASAPGGMSRIVDIPLSGDTLPASVLKIVLVIDIAGRRFTESFNPNTNLSYRFVWDGLNAYDRPVVGWQRATVKIGYVYPAVYYPVRADLERSFARFAPSTTATVTSTRVETTIALWKTWWVNLGGPIGDQIGGWGLDAHHKYDVAGKVLYLGDGTSHGAEHGLSRNIIRTVAGTGVIGDSGDGGPATDAELYFPTGVAVGPDGSLYIAAYYHFRVRRVGPEGIITAFAGTGVEGYSGDGGPAIDAELGCPYYLAVGPDGSLYMTDPCNQCVRRVGPDGIITTVAGTGVLGYSGDGGPATNAQLCNPAGVAVGPDGSLYIADNGNNRVRRVGPDGIITTVAGTGVTTTSSGDGGPATNATFYGPTGVAVGPDGSFYIAISRNNRVRRVGPDGIITTVAGTGNFTGSPGDGGPATNAQLNNAKGVAVAQDGSYYITNGADRIRRVGLDGIITTVAGTGVGGYSGDGGPATNATLNQPFTVVVGPDGSIYFTDNGNHRVRRVGSIDANNIGWDELSVASEDAGRLYVFDEAGRHLRTQDALTGAVLYRFQYDVNGLLTRVEDGDGNATTIERNAAGEPTAVIGPYGHRTALTLDSNGYLAEITSPGGKTLHFVYGSEGLLREMTDAKGNKSLYDYNDTGRLVKDSDAAGGSLSLVRTDIPNGFEVTTTSGLGKVTTYRTEDLPAGGKKMVDTYQDGTTVQTVIGTNGARTITMSDGTVASLTQGPDPRFGMQAPIVTATTLTTRGGLRKVTSMQRTATLADPNNPLSLLTFTDNVNINGRLYANFIDMATKERTMTSPEGRKLVSTFDAQGRISKKEFGNLNPVSYAYDARGRLEKMTQGSGTEAREFTITYNDQGYPATMSGPLSVRMDLEYDADGRVSRRILGDGRTISYGYDAAGNINSITPPGRPSHLFSFSPVNLAKEYTAPDAGAGASVTALEFDKDKRFTSLTRPDGSSVTMGYDSAGRPTTKTFPRGTLTYGYDPVTGALRSLTAPDGGVLTINYDGYLTTRQAWTGDVTGTVDSVYNNNFWLIRRSVNNQAIEFGYDNDSLLVRAGGLTLTRDLASGVVKGTVLGAVSDTRHYTGFGEMDEYQVTYSGSDYYTAQYAYDKLGRIIQKTEEIIGVGSNVYGYSYDVTSRLTGVSINGINIAIYTYDSNGNRLSFVSSGSTTSGTYDAQDRLTHYGDKTYIYTANGELSSKTDSGGTTTYQYDALGNLMSVTLPGGTTIEYVIDGANRRIGKKRNNVLVKGLLYKDQLKPVAELDAGNNMVSRFVYGSRINVPDYMVTQTATYRIISDRLGSPRIVIDVATGQIAQRLDYDEFGKVLVDTNPGFQPFGFAGGLYDPDTGLVRFGARDYDPQTGRWTAKDPIMFAGRSQNLYAYVLNNPVNLMDPSGRVFGPYGPGDIDKTNNGPPDAKLDPSLGKSERVNEKSCFMFICWENGNYEEHGRSKDGIDYSRSCSDGVCEEKIWDPKTETSGNAAADCQDAKCNPEEDLKNLDPSDLFPGESLPPAQPTPPSPSDDLPLEPIPLPAGKKCNLNIWKDANGNIINVVKVK